MPVIVARATSTSPAAPSWTPRSESETGPPSSGERGVAAVGRKDGATASGVLAACGSVEKRSSKRDGVRVDASGPGPRVKATASPIVARSPGHRVDADVGALAECGRAKQRRRGRHAALEGHGGPAAARAESTGLAAGVARARRAEAVRRSRAGPSSRRARTATGRQRRPVLFAGQRDVDLDERSARVLELDARSIARSSGLAVPNAKLHRAPEPTRIPSRSETRPRRSTSALVRLVVPATETSVDGDVSAPTRGSRLRANCGTPSRASVATCRAVGRRLPRTIDVPPVSLDALDAAEPSRRRTRTSVSVSPRCRPHPGTHRHIERGERQNQPGRTAPTARRGAAAPPRRARARVRQGRSRKRYERSPRQRPRASANVVKEPAAHAASASLTRGAAEHPAIPERHKQKEPASSGLSKKIPAASYSPTRLPVQYHRLRGA